MNDSAQDLKCPCCGGSIEFNPGQQQMSCPYCGTSFDMETIIAYAEDLKQDTADDLKWANNPGGSWEEQEAAGLRTFTCVSCGGKIIVDEHTAAMSCPYCGSSVTMTGSLMGDLRPDMVIPFKFDRQAAIAALHRYYKGKKLLPKAFKDENHIAEVQGVYVPVWAFDATAHGNMRFKSTKSASWSDSQYVYTETSYYDVRREGTVDYSGVPVDGSSKMDDALMESLEPYDISEAVPFETPYLAGYMADRYDVDAETSMPRASERIKATTADVIKGTVSGYDSVITESSAVSLAKSHSSYVLYPVWTLSTQYDGQYYLFAMNGQTGKMVGELPMDKGLYAIWFAALSVGVAVVVFIICFLLWWFI